jgi:catechol-2,3-dioxygenase
MKRMHVHVRVADLAHNIRFYSALFNAEPTVVKPDYAKWMLDDPRINFAISSRSNEVGLDHLGFQVESEEELQEMNERLAKADLPIETQEGTACCYAKSNKHWTVDPQGIAWESYHTLDSIPVFGESHNTATEDACCAPAAKIVPVAACCTPSSGKTTSGCC